MDNNKLTISIDDLLAAVKEGKVEEHVGTEDPILEFLVSFNIKGGTHSIPSTLLFKLFKTFNNTYNKSKMSFNTALGQYLPTKYSGAKRYYLVDQDSIQLGKTLNSIMAQEKRRPVTRSKTKHKQFERFLQECELEGGKLFVENDILYYVYNNWCDDTRKRPMSFQEFASLASLYLEKRRLSESEIIWYGVTESIKKLINETSVRNWREGRRKKHTGYKNQAPKEKYHKDVLYAQEEKDKT